ncbi:MAG TPA: CDP-alcohol phosphatidyltransferase family protein [Bryobacteraceae bacterium]|nr:CDP-alcohol phosphatidyltransferase family protein [Bryobacteraceae bacterium]
MWTIPTFFTLLRLFMTPFILVELARGHYIAGGWMFGGAAFTDIIDGGLARRFGAESKFGQYLDPIADKLLLTSVYIGLALGGAIPKWVMAVVLGRDVWILALAGIAFLFTSFRNLKPSLWGKLSTFAQIMAAVAVMGARAYNYNGFSVIGEWLIGAVVVLAVISAADYGWRGISYLRAGRGR